MDHQDIAASFTVSLPEWVLSEIADDALVLPEAEDRMRLVHRLAERNHREGTGGPFAALVADLETGRILSVGVNMVLATNLSCVHAEVVALSLAQTKSGYWDLGAAAAPRTELMVNWRPCAMCYGAAMWSGIERLTIAGYGDEVEKLTGFDEGPMREDWKQQFHERGITVVTDLLREEAIDVFRNYGLRTDVTVYNARQRQQ